jgi:enamine deaminase RidA (YjgF/YER057c/UK114 family)
MAPIETRLADLGVTLPDASAPAANYVPYVITGTLLHVSGQISQDANGLIRGKLGLDMDVPAGAAAAQRCAVSLLAQVRNACGGDFSRLVRVVKLTGFVNSTPEFTDQPRRHCQRKIPCGMADRRLALPCLMTKRSPFR